MKERKCQTNLDGERKIERYLTALILGNQKVENPAAEIESRNIAQNQYFSQF